MNYKISCTRHRDMKIHEKYLTKKGYRCRDCTIADIESTPLMQFYWDLKKSAKKAE